MCRKSCILDIILRSIVDPHTLKCIGSNVEPHDWFDGVSGTGDFSASYDNANASPTDYFVVGVNTFMIDDILTRALTLVQRSICDRWFHCVHVGHQNKL